MKRKAAFKTPKLEIFPAHPCKGIHGVSKNKINISVPNILVNIAVVGQLTDGAVSWGSSGEANSSSMGLGEPT